MQCVPFPLNPLPHSGGDGEKFVVGFAHTEQGSALHLPGVKRNAVLEDSRFLFRCYSTTRSVTAYFFPETRPARFSSSTLQSCQVPPVKASL